MTDTTDTNVPVAVQKPRRRFVVGKCFFGLLVLFIVASAGGRVWWGWYADRQYQAVVDRIRARGEPVTWAEMKPPSIPDDQNAVEVYKRVLAMPEFQKAMDLTVAPKSATQPAAQAGGASGGPSAVDEFVLLDKPLGYGKGEALREKLDDKEFRSKHPEFVKTFLRVSERLLAEMAKAHGLNSDWKLNYDQSLMKAVHPGLTEYVNLVRIPWICALAAHDRGDDALAIECMGIGWDVGESPQSGQMLVPHLVSVTDQTLVSLAIEQLAVDLRVGAAPAAGRPEVEELISRLLDMRGTTSSLSRAFMTERAFGQDAIRMILEDPRSISQLQGEYEPRPSRTIPLPARALISLASGPMWKMQASEHMEFMDSYVLAAKSGPASFTAPTPGWMNNPTPLDHVTHAMSMLLTPALSRVFAFQNRTLATRRMSATALAIRLYELDNGKRPATLAELCPKYLQTIPEDPFDPAKGAIRYLPNAKYPILYSIGPDGLDDGGRFGVRGSAVKYVDWEKLDMPFFLGGPDDRQKAIDELTPSPAATFGPGGPRWSLCKNS